MTASQINETMIQLSKCLEKSAEVTSPCPDLPQRLWTRDGYPRNSRQSLALLLVLPLVSRSTRNVDLYLDLVEHVKKMYLNYYQQESWKIVGEVLSHYHSKTPADLIEYISSTMSTEDWFGNFVPELRRAIRSIKIQSLDYSVVSDTRPVKRPKRKRGYDDKGTYQFDPWPRIGGPELIRPIVVIEDPPKWRLWSRYKKGR